jgi:hypothetical protein
MTQDRQGVAVRHQHPTGRPGADRGAAHRPGTRAVHRRRSRRSPTGKLSDVSDAPTERRQRHLLRHRPCRGGGRATAQLDAAAAGLEAAGAFIQEGGELAHQCQAIIASSAELRERELIKLASLAAALAEALRRRGVEDPAASLTAEAGIAVFKAAFERYVEETNQQDLPRLIRESLDELKAVTATARQ